MKILQVVHSLPFLNQAGTELYTQELSLELSKKHQVYIFSRNCDIKQKEYAITKKIIGGIVIYLVNNTFRQCDSFKMFYENEEIDQRFAEILDEIAPDVVHIQHVVFLSMGLIRKITAKGIPIVFTLHDFWLMCPKWHILKKDLIPCDRAFNSDFDRECLACIAEMLAIKRGAKKMYLFSKGLMPASLIHWLKKAYFAYERGMSDNNANIDKLKERGRVTRTLLNSVNSFIAPSEYLRNRFIQFGIPAWKIKFLRHGFNNNLFIDTQKTKADKIRFAFIGTILPAKGLHLLIRAFNNIDIRCAELKIYGKLYSYPGYEYYLPYLKKTIKNKNIRLMGDFSHLEIAKIFKEADVIVVPSIWSENYPLVIQEAFLSKTPVIASRIGGIPELIKDGINGLLFNPRDANDLYEKIQYVIDNTDILEKFKVSMPQVKGIEDNAKELEEIYTNLLTTNNRSEINIQCVS